MSDLTYPLTDDYSSDKIETRQGTVWMRYIRAFIRTLQITATGESLIPARFRPLDEWITAGLQKLDHFEQVADENGLTVDQREAIQLKIDGRNITMQRVLLMLRHNFQTEYPKLMKFNDEYSPMVVQTSNFNDQYRVQRLLDSDEIKNPGIYTALGNLSEHLYAMPEIKNETD